VFTVRRLAQKLQARPREEKEEEEEEAAAKPEEEKLQE
jgi:hypothetical protein